MGALIMAVTLQQVTEKFNLTVAGGALETTAIESNTDAVVTNIHCCNESDTTDAQILLEFYDATDASYTKMEKYRVPSVPNSRESPFPLKDFNTLDTGDKLRFTAYSVDLTVIVQYTTRTTTP